MVEETLSVEDAIKVKLRTRTDRLLRLIDLNAPWPIISSACSSLSQAVHDCDGRWGINSPIAKEELALEEPFQGGLTNG